MRGPSLLFVGAGGQVSQAFQSAVGMQRLQNMRAAVRCQKVEKEVD